MCRMLRIRENSEAMLHWEARVLWVFAWAIITLTHHVLGKCRQYSAAQRHDGWCVCRHRWTVDPIISWGRKGGARHRWGEIRDDWLNQNRGPSWLAVCWHYLEAIVGVNVTAQWQQRAVIGSKKIKCVLFLKWGRGRLFTWGEKLPVIKNISRRCWDSSLTEIRQEAYFSREGFYTSAASWSDYIDTQELTDTVCLTLIHTAQPPSQTHQHW